MRSAPSGNELKCHGSHCGFSSGVTRHAIFDEAEYDDCLFPSRFRRGMMSYESFQSCIGVMGRAGHGRYFGSRRAALVTGGRSASAALRRGRSTRRCDAAHAAAPRWQDRTGRTGGDPRNMIADRIDKRAALAVAGVTGTTGSGPEALAADIGGGRSLRYFRRGDSPRRTR